MNGKRPVSLLTLPGYEPAAFARLVISGTDMHLKKMAWFWGVGLIVGLYTTFVLQQLWNWFLAPSLHLSEISYWVMYGIQLLFSLLFSSAGQEAKEAQSWKLAFLTLDACVPEERREKLAETLKEYESTLWMDVGSRIFGLVVGNTITLAIGWGIHTFLQ